jgi:hypothetical protein
MNKRLTIIGLWSNRLVIYPHPRQLMQSKLSPAERDAIASYIETCPDGNFVSSAPFLEEDCLLSREQHFEYELRSDGTWLFPVSLAYYVRQGVCLPRAFVEHVHRIRSAPVHEPIRQSEFAINEIYWMIWSLSHSSWNSYAALHAIRVVLGLPLYLLFYLFRRCFRRDIW